MFIYAYHGFRNNDKLNFIHVNHTFAVNKKPRAKMKPQVYNCSVAGTLNNSQVFFVVLKVDLNLQNPQSLKIKIKNWKRNLPIKLCNYLGRIFWKRFDVSFIYTQDIPEPVGTFIFLIHYLVGLSLCNYPI